MKKFNLKGVFEGFRSSVAHTTKQELEFQENLKSYDFFIKRTFHHGFPFEPTSMAYDPIQNLLAIGTKNGSLRIIGRPGVDIYVRHDLEDVVETNGGIAVTYLVFCINEGHLISVTSNNTTYLWNYRQKPPQVVQSLKFQKDKITSIHLPIQSKWLYIGSDRGNVHVVHVESFTLSGYIINWNKAIEISRKTHPGAVVHLSDNPLDTSKLLIGYETGLVVLWDLKNRTSEFRCQTSEPICSISWHHDGKQFLCSQTDGSIVCWHLKQNEKPIHIFQPHGLPNDQSRKCNPVSVINSVGTTILDMDNSVVDFIVISDNPWNSELRPQTLITLTQNDLVLMDLQMNNYPLMENPYSMDIHESSVTYVYYMAACPDDLIPILYSVGRSISLTKKSAFSDRDWPINGGEWSIQSSSYSEIIITGHVDGSLKFWDASAGNLQILYKLKTAKLFEKPAAASSIDFQDDDLFGIQFVSFCPETKKLCVSNTANYVIVFSFHKTEKTSDVSVIEVPLSVDDEDNVLDDDNEHEEKKDLNVKPLSVIVGAQKRQAGFQPKIICVPMINKCDPVPQITSLEISSSYGLMAYGHEYGLVIIDIVQKICVFNMKTQDIYFVQDPQFRNVRSPKKFSQTEEPEKYDETVQFNQSIDYIKKPLKTSPCLEMDIDKAIENVHKDSDVSLKAEQILKKKSSKVYKWKSIIHKRQLGKLQLKSNDECRENCTNFDESLSQAHAHLINGCANQSGGSVNVNAGSSIVNQMRSRPEPPRRSRSQDKFDNPFSRSRSSSTNSLEHITSESVNSLIFADSYILRSEPNYVVPTLWIGTNSGTVLTLILSLPSSELRESQPISITTSGATMFRLKGSIVSTSLLDFNQLMSSNSNEGSSKKSSNRMSPTYSEFKGDAGDKQFVVVTSEKQVRVYTLPSHCCLYRNQVPDSDFIVKTEMMILTDEACLVCYLSNGHIIAYSLPSLNILIDVEFLPVSELNFQTRNRKGIIDPMLSIWGQQMICKEDIVNMAICDTISDLWISNEMPEPPKEGFLKGLFGVGQKQFDREQLFGEASGKGSNLIAKYAPGSLADAQQKSGTATSDISKAHKAVVERGDKLNQLEERSERMSTEAERFSQNAQALMVLDEAALNVHPVAKRPLFVFEYLRHLDQLLLSVDKDELKINEKQLVDRLIELLSQYPYSPIRKLLAKCLAVLFSLGDPFLIFDVVNKYNDILRNKDDSPSFLPIKLTAITCLGVMYEKLGRMMGRTYEETVAILLKCIKNGESKIRIEVLAALEKICRGMGSVILNLSKDIYKVAKSCLVDRVMAVRCASAKCLLEMLNYNYYMYTTDIENMITLCFRAFDASNYEVRCTVAYLLGAIIANSQNNTNSAAQKSTKTMSLDECLGLLMTGFLRGGNSFLKGTGEIIKGGYCANRDVRVGVTYAYVVFAELMGGYWIEKYIRIFVPHILYLVSNPKAASSHIDAIYSRKCVNFILRNVLGKTLNEKSQFLACKEIVSIVMKEIENMDFSPENAKDLNQETLFSQHLLICALNEIANLVTSLGTCVQDLLNDSTLNFLETCMSVLVHPCLSTRLAAAWCLRCVCIAVPSYSTTLIDKCIFSLEKKKTSESVSGYSGTIASIVSVVKSSPLGIPYLKGKEIFNIAEELLRTANQNSRHSLSKINNGWLLMGSITTLGDSVVNTLLPRMLLLWRNAFPKSFQDLDSEKARGDAFTWQVTLESRAGALSSMNTFIGNCPHLLTEEIEKRLTESVASAIRMLINLQSVLRSYGQQLKLSSALVRLRLYEIILTMQSNDSVFDSFYIHLLKMIVSEFTLIDNQSNITTSLIRIVCHADDSILLGSWIQETDHRFIENQIQPISGTGSGTLENDITYLYRSLNSDERIPTPYPIGVQAIDNAILLFGQIFIKVSIKQRLEILESFHETIKSAKSARQEVIQTNIFIAILYYFKQLSSTKLNVESEDIRNSLSSLIMGSLVCNNSMLRIIMAENVGRFAQVICNSKQTTELIQIIYEKLKLARDVLTRTGYTLALGCVHKYVGGLETSYHLNTSVSILTALAQDITSPIVQVWSLHALILISESSGPLFRCYVEPSLSLCLRLLFHVPQSCTDVHQCIGKFLSSLIQTIGPEFQANVELICSIRVLFLSACAILHDHPDHSIQAEATICLQQLHLFMPNFVDLSSLVPTLNKNLSSKHLFLRKAALSCLKQLSQKEGKEVCDCILSFTIENSNESNGDLSSKSKGLQETLFAMLNTETDVDLIKDIHDTLISLLIVLASDNIYLWLTICKDVLAVTNEDSTKLDNDEKDVEIEEDDCEFQSNLDDFNVEYIIQPRWPTKVFAAECVRKIIRICEKNSIHFNLKSAKDYHSKDPNNDYLVLHLSELVRMAFMAATSSFDQLRLEGLKLLFDIIEKFSRVRELEFHDHLILEQYQAQIGAALRPAFLPNTSSHIIAAACEVCAIWISSNISNNPNDLKRVYQLLVKSLSKLELTTNDTHNLFNESLITLEKLAILKAWADVYIVSVNDEYSSQSNQTSYRFGLLDLVEPHLKTLSNYWIDAIQDFALLSLPSEFYNQLPRDGGAFYKTFTMDKSRIFYVNSWQSIIRAIVISMKFNVIPWNETKFNLLFGICVECLCNPRSSESVDNVTTCLDVLLILLSLNDSTQYLLTNRQITVELLNILYRLILTRDNFKAQNLCLKVVNCILVAQIHLNNQSNTISEKFDIYETDFVDEKSIFYALLEVHLCLLIRYFPNICYDYKGTFSTKVTIQYFDDDFEQLLCNCFNNFCILQKLCSKKGALQILPTILFVCTEVIREVTSNKSRFNVKCNKTVIDAILSCLKTLCASEYNNDNEWQQLLQSALSKVIDMAKTSDFEEINFDKVAIMHTISIFIIHSPLSVISAPNLQYPLINYFQTSLQNTDLNIQLKCIQIIKNIFVNSNEIISKRYIRSLAAKILRILYFKVIEKRDENDDNLRIIDECIQVVELLVSLTEPANRIYMISLLTPILFRFLLNDTDLRNSSRYSCQLHEICLKCLMRTAPKYVSEFKKFVSESNDLRQKLEIAIKSAQNRNKDEIVTLKTGKEIQQPKIQLKTDFHNFS